MGFLIACAGTGWSETHAQQTIPQFFPASYADELISAARDKAFFNSMTVTVLGNPVQSPRKWEGAGPAQNYPHIWTVSVVSSENVLLTLVIAAHQLIDNVTYDPSKYPAGTYGIRPFPKPGNKLAVIGRQSLDGKLSFFEPGTASKTILYESLKRDEFAVFAYFQADEKLKSSEPGILRVIETLDSSKVVELFELARLMSRIEWYGEKGYPSEIGKAAFGRASLENDPEKIFAWHFMAWSAGYLRSGILAREQAAKLQSWPVPDPAEFLKTGWSRYHPDPVLIEYVNDKDRCYRSLIAAAESKTPEARWYALWGLGKWQERFRPLCIKILQDSIRDKDTKSINVLASTLGLWFPAMAVDSNPSDPLLSAQQWITFLTITATADA